MASTSTTITRELGVGIGWRAEIDLTVERLPGLDFVEVVAESVCPDHLPESLRILRSRGLPVIPHGVTLSLGSAAPPERERLHHLAGVATALDSPLVSEHAAFVRAGGHDAGHLLPVPRTREGLRVLAANVALAQAHLPVPLAVENVAALLGWPDDELTEGQFLAELVERTGVGLLLDVENLYANQVNLGLDALAALDQLPLEAVAYVHVAGGVLREGVWHDTHAHPVAGAVLDLLAAVCERVRVPGVLLERDDAYPTQAALAAELAAIRRVFEAPGPLPIEQAGRLTASLSAGRGTAGTVERTVAGTAAGTAAGAAERTAAGTVAGTVAGTAAGGAPATGPLAGSFEPIARAALAQRETEMLGALVGGEPVPPRFDQVRMDMQARALLGKRRQVVARLRPDLAEAENFRERFDAYAAVNPRPGAGARAEAEAFARSLRPPEPAIRRGW